MQPLLLFRAMEPVALPPLYTCVVAVLLDAHAIG